MGKIKTIIGAKQLQKFMQLEGTYSGQIDGILGRKSIAGATDLLQREGIQMTASWSPERVFIAIAQLLFVELGFDTGGIDGLYGPSTGGALERYQNLMRDTDASSEERAQQSTIWPTYRNMTRFYGPVGQNIERYTLPYRMVLAWDTDAVVNRMSLNKKCGESAIGCLEAARDHYGISALQDMGMHLFGGSLNVRKMRGGSNYSVHSWAAAIDFDPLRNQFRWTNHQAKMDDPEFDKWWAIWEAAGWVSLGRERNFDWQHIQAARL